MSSRRGKRPKRRQEENEEEPEIAPGDQGSNKEEDARNKILEEAGFDPASMPEEEKMMIYEMLQESKANFQQEEEMRQMRNVQQDLLERSLTSERAAASDRTASEAECDSSNEDLISSILHTDDEEPQTRNTKSKTGKKVDKSANKAEEKQKPVLSASPVYEIDSDSQDGGHKETQDPTSGIEETQDPSADADSGAEATTTDEENPGVLHLSVDDSCEESFEMNQSVQEHHTMELTKIYKRNTLGGSVKGESKMPDELPMDQMSDNDDISRSSLEKTAYSQQDMDMTNTKSQGKRGNITVLGDHDMDQTALNKSQGSRGKLGNITLLGDVNMDQTNLSGVKSQTTQNKRGHITILGDHDMDQTDLSGGKISQPSQWSSTSQPTQGKGNTVLQEQDMELTDLASSGKSAKSNITNFELKSMIESPCSSGGRSSTDTGGIAGETSVGKENKDSPSADEDEVAIKKQRRKRKCMQLFLDDTDSQDEAGKTEDVSLQCSLPGTQESMSSQAPVNPMEAVSSQCSLPGTDDDAGSDDNKDSDDSQSSVIFTASTPVASRHLVQESPLSAVASRHTAVFNSSTDDVCLIPETQDRSADVTAEGEATPGGQQNSVAYEGETVDPADDLDLETQDFSPSPEIFSSIPDKTTIRAQISAQVHRDAGLDTDTEQSQVSDAGRRGAERDAETEAVDSDDQMEVEDAVDKEAETVADEVMEIGTEVGRDDWHELAAADAVLQEASESFEVQQQHSPGNVEQRAVTSSSRGGKITHFLESYCHYEVHMLTDQEMGHEVEKLLQSSKRMKTFDAFEHYRDSEASEENNNMSQEPTSPIKPLINHRQLRRRLSDPFPMFAPPGVDCLSYTTNLCDYWDGYYKTVRCIQDQSPDFLPWGKPIVVGNHVKNSLDVVVASDKVWLLDADETIEDKGESSREKRWAERQKKREVTTFYGKTRSARENTAETVTDSLPDLVSGAKTQHLSDSDSEDFLFLSRKRKKLESDDEFKPSSQDRKQNDEKSQHSFDAFGFKSEQEKIIRKRGGTRGRGRGKTRLGNKMKKLRAQQPDIGGFFQNQGDSDDENEEIDRALQASKADLEKLKGSTASRLMDELEDRYDDFNNRQEDKGLKLSGEATFGDDVSLSSNSNRVTPVGNIDSNRATPVDNIDIDVENVSNRNSPIEIDDESRESSFETCDATSTDKNRSSVRNTPDSDIESYSSKNQEMPTDLDVGTSSRTATPVEFIDENVTKEENKSKEASSTVAIDKQSRNSAKTSKTSKDNMAGPFQELSNLDNKGRRTRATSRSRSGSNESRESKASVGNGRGRTRARSKSRSVSNDPANQSAYSENIQKEKHAKTCSASSRASSISSITNDNEDFRGFQDDSTVISSDEDIVVSDPLEKKKMEQSNRSQQSISELEKTVYDTEDDEGHFALKKRKKKPAHVTPKKADGGINRAVKVGDRVLPSPHQKSLKFPPKENVDKPKKKGRNPVFEFDFLSDPDSPKQMKPGMVTYSRTRGERLTRKGKQPAQEVKLISCPLCNKRLPQTDIEVHAANCLGDSQPEDSGSSTEGASTSTKPPAGETKLQKRKREDSGSELEELEVVEQQRKRGREKKVEQLHPKKKQTVMEEEDEGETSDSGQGQAAGQRLRHGQPSGHAAPDRVVVMKPCIICNEAVTEDEFEQHVIMCVDRAEEQNVANVENQPNIQSRTRRRNQHS